MTETSKQRRCRSLMFGVALVFAAVVAGAVPFAEKVSSPKPGKVSKGKAVHYIESRSESGSNAHVDTKGVELPLPIPEKSPVSESSPLELKGVRG